MIIKSLKLENIRSYTNQTIEFPDGSTLLAGDIGAGKSSILLSIEFALFGVSRKHLSAGSLLRHGKTQGSVELTFHIDDKEIIIKRNLKRGKDDIKQEAGYIIVDGLKKEGTHVELKSDVLELLGYPSDLLTKSKDLIYRYTVYTPQEEMKQILYEDKDLRLDTLRKVFNIDKYKRIRENSQILSKDLRVKIINSEGRLADFDEKKNQRLQREEEIKQIEIKIKELAPKLGEIQIKVKDRKLLLLAREKEIEEFKRLKNEFDVLEMDLKNKVEQKARDKQNIERLNLEIETLKKELVGKQEFDFLTKIKHNNDELNSYENKLKDFSKKRYEAESIKKHSAEIKNKISKIDKCPTCEQEVKHEHKSFIDRREEDKIAKADIEINQSKENELLINKKIKEIKDELEILRKKQQESSVFKIKFSNLKEKEHLKQKLVVEQDTIKLNIGKINLKKVEITKKLSQMESIVEDYKKLKKDTDLITQEERKLAIAKAELDREKQTVAKMIEFITKEIEQKEKIKQELKKTKNLKEWIDKLFINLMVTIEKHVMLQIYHEFNELFERWFDILIEDENLNVRLNDEFTPLIEQNGYETMLENLSGGEKTAVALAYRLALNQVINNIIAKMKTKDLIILDEPTDGFSTDQLDKIRDVIEQLAIKQIIIVSHENKIESFVDNVVRIVKNEHVSCVV